MIFSCESILTNLKEKKLPAQELLGLFHHREFKVILLSCLFCKWDSFIEECKTAKELEIDEEETNGIHVSFSRKHWMSTKIIRLELSENLDFTQTR